MGKTEYLLIIILFNVFLLAFTVAAITFVVQYKNKKKENQSRLVQQQILHQKELLTTEIEIQLQTMQHIGREIHDNVGQKLTLASLYTQQLAYENKSPDRNEKIENIGEIINQSLAELRHLSKSLTDNTIEKANISHLLRQEFEKIVELKKYKINFDITNEDLALSYQTKSVIVRVAQEFLQNSMKYASCETISILVAKRDNELKIVLSDDGIGFDIENYKNSGIGLVNMKKRVELIGGRYFLQSTKNEGTILTIEISLA
ncbi:MAG: two-component sensor histidine kinase [Pedobacter sp.]|nr:two-component sensor histidine kinase [Pedobacter sp.]